MQMCRAQRELSKATVETIWIGLHDELFTVEAVDVRYPWASSWSSQIEVQFEVRASENDVTMCKSVVMSLAHVALNWNTYIDLQQNLQHDAWRFYDVLEIPR